MKSFEDILLLGNPTLYEKSEPVQFKELQYIQSVVNDLHEVMMDFRINYGFGKAIAAPQIGVNKRLIYMYIDHPVVIINPVYAYQSEEMFELWDNCMSFPNLMVRVKRHKSVVLKYKDMNWNDQLMEGLDAMAELIQHEYDHLDGILAAQRAIDDQSLKIVNPKEYFKQYA